MSLRMRANSPTALTTVAVATTLWAMSCGPPTASVGPSVDRTGAPTTDPDVPVYAQAGAQPTEPTGATPPSTPSAQPQPPSAPADTAPARPVPAPATAATPHPAGPSGQLAGLLEAHNQFRARHCAPPMTWSDKLAQGAQQWADTLRAKGCLFGHDNDTPHGENLAFFRPIGRVDGPGAVAGWYGEVDDYDFNNPGFSMETGHFTQLVWTDTTALGCGVVECAEGEIWVCRYDPPGNYRGQYESRVLPTSCQ